MFDVIIPIYRIDPALFKRCVDSVFAQSLNDYTVWVVDGTPTDADTYAGCMQLVEEYDNHPGLIISDNLELEFPKPVMKP